MTVLEVLQNAQKILEELDFKNEWSIHEELNSVIFHLHHKYPKICQEEL